MYVNKYTPFEAGIYILEENFYVTSVFEYIDSNR